jgi:hypothetical protein
MIDQTVSHYRIVDKLGCGMPHEKIGPHEWLRDVEARQHNIVFPDTAQNEATF